MKSIFLSFLTLTLMLLACSHSNNIRNRIQDDTITRNDLRKDRNTIERTEPAKETIFGLASYYGTDFHGKKTANGEVYDMYGLTAAHKTLPFNTICRVTNLENGKSVDVRINDRGPFIAGRDLDLSHGAAEAIDALLSGVIKVKIEILNFPEN